MAAEPDEEQWNETERAVRSLLEAAVPAPRPSSERMAGIRRKARRRRRRNAAALGAALTAVAGLAFVLPGLRDADPSHGAASTPSSPVTLIRGPGAPVRLLGPARAVEVTLPRGWYAVSVDDARGGPVAFIASQPLSRPARGTCVSGTPGAVGTCRPLTRLADGEVLIVLRPAGKREEAARLTASPVKPSLDGCESLGAQGRSRLWKVGRSGAADFVVLEMSECSRTPVAKATSDALSGLLNSIRLADGT
ncbi:MULTISPECIES: hypothetical protein [Streptomyces]|uniref:Uncharacterized protein n=1 Tax=Streptomyces canarius TaxID=285453 RepID=A0ABQ3D9A9_9ACTN|nr:hypothetical protein [Streptomyces canarius]GHA63677.1 hypothetical protein GCM10010345_79810 [Streptomyces canarius]